MTQEISKKALDTIIVMQKNEITEFYIYRNIAKRIKDEKNRDILLKIANEEKRHYGIWARYTKKEIEPNRFKITFLLF